MPRESQDGGRAEVYHMLICRGRAKMGRGRGISHVDMPRESQDGWGRGISHVDMSRESQDGGAEVYHMLICRGRAKMGGQRYITC